MRRNKKIKLKQRFYGYIHGEKDINVAVQRIVDDIELLTIDYQEDIKRQQHSITKLKHKLKNEVNQKKSSDIKIIHVHKDGTVIEGRIVWMSGNRIDVELDSPLKGKSCINFGFASAMSGHFVHDKKGNISEAGIEGARMALGWAYENALEKKNNGI